MDNQQQLIPLCTGERLRQEREKRGISLEQAALKLHVDIDVMRSIEDDTLDHLAPVYRRGYISSYAEFLGFEAAETKQMLESVSTDHPELRTVFPEAGNPNQADRWLKATSYVLASLLVGTLAWQFTHEAVRLSRDGAERVAGQEDTLTGTARNTLSPDTQQIKGATHVNASIASLEVHTEQNEVLNGAGNEAWAALQGTPGDETLPLPLADREFTLELTASGDSWVEISDASGRQLELDLVRGGTSKEYRGLAPFSIQFGRASAVSLYLDGQVVDLSPFTDGDVTQMTLEGLNSGSSATAEEPGSG